MRNATAFALALVLFLSLVFRFASASTTPEVIPANSGESIACTEDKTGFVDVITGSLSWSHEFLNFASDTENTVSFSMHYCSNSSGNDGFGTSSRWSHTYDISIQYTSGPPAILTLRNNEGALIPFLYDSVNGIWLSDPSSGLFLTCAVSNGFVINDRFGNTMSFDTYGKLTAIVDRFNRTITLSYITSGAAVGYLWKVTDSWGRAFELTYDNTPLITSLLDLTIQGNPAWLQFTYSNGDLTVIRKGYSSGQLFADYTFEYQGSGSMISYTEPDGCTTDFAYSNGFLTTATDVDNNTWSFAYGASQSTFTDRRGNTFTYTFDASLGVVTSISYPVPCQQWGTTATESWVYNGDRLVIQYTDKKGNTTDFTYDSNGNRLTEAKTVSTPYGSQSITKTWTYDQFSRVITFTDPKGNTTTNTYDQAGRLSSVIYPQTPTGATPVESYTYNANSQVANVTGALNNTLSKTYDANGKIASVTTPMGKVTSYTYDTWGHKLTETNPAGVLHRFEYNDCYNCVADETAFDSQGGFSRTEYSYSPGGRLIGKTLPNDVYAQLGYTYTYYYNSLNRLVREKDCYGYSKYYEYDENGNRIAYAHEVDHAAGRSTTTWVYDTWNRLMTETDAGNYSVSWEYDSSSNQLVATDKCGKSIVCVYDELNRKISETNSLFYTRYWEYDQNNNIIKYTNSLGDSWISTYDNANHLIREYDPYNCFIEHTYDIAGRKIGSKDKNGNITSYTYNSDNLLTAETNPAGGVRNLSYDNANRIVSVSGTGVAAAETLVYNYQGQQIESRDSSNTLIWAKVFDRNATCIQEADGNGNVTNYAVNRVGMITAITYADQSVSTFTYDAAWRKTSGVTPMGTVWNYELDQRGLVSRQYGYFTQNGQQLLTQTTYTFDGAGRELTKTNSNGIVWTTTYDDLGRVSTKTDPDSGTNFYSYNGEGSLIAETSNGCSFSYSNDKLGRMLTKTDALGATWIYTYDANGNRTRMVEPLGNITDYSYNSMNLCTFVAKLGNLNDPNDDRIETATYYLNGNKATQIKSSGETICYYYDIRSRLSREEYPNPTQAGNIVEEFWYDNANLKSEYLQTTIVSSLRIQYSYNSRCWMTSRTMTITVPDAPVLTKGNSREYDLDGKLICEITTEGDINTFEYNEMGWATSSTIRDTTVIDMTKQCMRSEYEYDAGGRKIEERKYSGGPGSWAPNVMIQFTYGYGNHLFSQQNAYNWLGLWNALDTVYMTYDSNGRLLQRIANSDLKFFAYDVAGQMLYDNGAWLTYDLNGNRLTQGQRTFTYGFFNEVATMQNTQFPPTYTFSYDSNGNETYHSDRPNELKTYNAKNQLVRHQLNNGHWKDFAYDDNGDMALEENCYDQPVIGLFISSRIAHYYYVSRKNCVDYNWNNSGPQAPWTPQAKWKHPAATDDFARGYGSATLPQYIDTACNWGCLYERYGFEPGMESPLAVDGKILCTPDPPITINGSFYLLDSSSCVTHVINANTSLVTLAVNYNGDGNNSVASGGGYNLEHKMGSGYEYPSVELVYFRNRWYNLSTGRFCSEDPLADIDHANLYLYCGNDPVNRSDPYGLSWWSSFVEVFNEVKETAKRMVVAAANVVVEVTKGMDNLVPGLSSVLGLDNFADIANAIVQYDKGMISGKEFASALAMAGLSIAMDSLPAGKLLKPLKTLLGKSKVGERFLHAIDKVEEMVPSKKKKADHGPDASPSSAKKVDNPVEDQTRKNSADANKCGQTKESAPANNTSNLNGSNEATMCFVAGTQILTVKGFKAIEDIRPGDSVWSRNQDTGEVGWKVVRQIFVSHPTVIVGIEYRVVAHNRECETQSSSDGDSDEDGELEGTWGHPFWSASHEEWVGMGDLEIGERILSASGDLLEVTAKRVEFALESCSFVTYNLEVEDWHTYFVLPQGLSSASLAVWVHNCGSTSSKAGPTEKKHYGSKGKPDHQEAVKNLKKQLEEERIGFEIVKEKKIRIDGCTRRPDISVYDKDGNLVEVFEVERRPKGKYHQDRIDEYKARGIKYSTIVLSETTK